MRRKRNGREKEMQKVAGFTFGNFNKFPAFESTNTKGSDEFVAGIANVGTRRSQALRLTRKNNLEEMRTISCALQKCKMDCCRNFPKLKLNYAKF